MFCKVLLLVEEGHWGQLCCSLPVDELLPSLVVAVVQGEQGVPYRGCCVVTAPADTGLTQVAERLQIHLQAHPLSRDT